MKLNLDHGLSVIEQTAL